MVGPRDPNDVTTVVTTTITSFFFHSSSAFLIFFSLILALCRLVSSLGQGISWWLWANITLAISMGKENFLPASESLCITLCPA